MPDTDNSNKTEIRSVPLYFMLVCGLVVFFAGLYLTLSHHFIKSVRLGGRYGGGSQQGTLDGRGILIIGLLFSAYPAYELLKKARKEREQKEQE